VARARFLVVLAACAVVGAAPARSIRAAAAPPADVLIELFTSEGCESCPPADEVLIELVRKQPVPGVRVIALSEHVDYWDQGGWKDPFSSAAFTRRQNDYAGALNADVYTPQLVIDGRTAVIGSNRGAVVAAIRSAAAKPKAVLTLTWVAGSGRDLQVTVPAAPMLADCRVFIAITEDRLSNQVKRGENAGRELRHDAVTRRMKALGSTEATGAFSKVVPVGPMLDAQWKPDALHVVVFVQNPKGVVLAVATNNLQLTTNN
jgi:hypothetical protein